jgi:Galactose-3-O-sulfotransferase
MQGPGAPAGARGSSCPVPADHPAGVIVTGVPGPLWGRLDSLRGSVEESLARLALTSYLTMPSSLTERLGNLRRTRTRPATNRCIIFLHLPKTAGETLRRTLRWKYGSEMLYLHTLTEPAESLEEVPLSKRQNARVLTGHLYYGVHEYIPQRCEYITLLRDPVARVISFYYYILGRTDHYRHKELVRSGMSLEEFVRSSPERGIENDQTRMLSGRGAGELDAGNLGREALDEAKRNLERFLVVGLTERFDESFIMIRRALGWKLPLYLTKNVSTRPKPASATAVELIRERNQLDLELYDYARGLFSAAVEQQGESLRHEVAIFKALNQVPNRIRPHTPAHTPAPVRHLLQRLPR